MITPTKTLNDDNVIPRVGFGVFKVDPAETERVVSSALEIGYRHIDTASIYGNEQGVGRAIAASGIPRDEIFVTTKLYNTDQGADSAHAALGRSLEALGLTHVDLYLIHWPSPARGKYVESWIALEELRALGLARSIGVSNFNPDHLDALAAASSTVPAVNQVELHPGFAQRGLRELHGRRGVATEAWGPLGQGKYPLLDEPVIRRIAAEHHATPAQIVLRWHLENDVIVIPKTVSASRAAENLDVFSLELAKTELDAIDALDSGLRVGADPETRN